MALQKAKFMPLCGNLFLICCAVFQQKKAQVVAVSPQTSIKFLHIQNACVKGLPVILRGPAQRCDAGKNSPYFIKAFRGKGRQPIPVADLLPV